jgi:hypothetical protein
MNDVAMSADVVDTLHSSPETVHAAPMNTLHSSSFDMQCTGNDAYESKEDETNK